MFGIKIIRESEYNDLKEVSRNYEAHKKEREIYEQTKKDCKSLREQNSELRKKIQEYEEVINMPGSEAKLKAEVKSLRDFKRDTLEAMGQIDLAGFRLQYCTKKCKHCENVQSDCKKYQFGSHEYCVIKK